MISQGVVMVLSFGGFFRKYVDLFFVRLFFSLG
jgi:hypothetical protein